jgi:hypothetical protein
MPPKLVVDWSATRKFIATALTGLILVRMAFIFSDLDGFQFLSSFSFLLGSSRKLIGSNCLMMERGAVPPYELCRGSCNILDAISCVDDMRRNISGTVHPKCTFRNIAEDPVPLYCCPRYEFSAVKGKTFLVHSHAAYPLVFECLAAVGCGENAVPYSSIFNQMKAECSAVCKDTVHPLGGDVCEPYEPEPDARPPICFAADESVLLDDGSTRRMNQVRVGDRVQTVSSDGQVGFSAVVFLPHRPNRRLAEFVTLVTSSGRSLRVTLKHLLPAGQCPMSGAALPLVAAETVGIGMCLRTLDGLDEVVSTQVSNGRGVYSLVTAERSGMLIVNGVEASSFGLLHAQMNIFYDFHRLVYKYAPSALSSIWASDANEMIELLAHSALESAVLNSII